MMPNPYNYNLPVLPEMFFGRQEQLAYAASQLLAPRGDSIALIGGRRMGKTSLLEALERHLGDVLAAPTKTPLPLPIFIDFTGVNVDSPQGFLQRVMAKAAGGWQYPDGQTVPGLPDEPLSPDQPGPEFQALLAGWSAQVSAAFHRQPRLILLLDECEHIVSHDWTPDLYRVLRFLLYNAPSRNVLKVVMAGSHRFLSQVYQAGSPLENILQYHRHRLYAFDRPAAEVLIQTPTGQQTPPAVAEAVWAESGGHPFLIQYLMHTLCERGLACSTPNDVLAAAIDFPRDRPDFRKWLDALGPTAAAAYHALVEDGPRLKVAAIRNRIPPADNLERVLEALRYHGLVQAEGYAYSATAVMFRRWFVESYLPDQPAAPPPQPTPTTPAPEMTLLVKLDADGRDANGPLLQRIDRLEGALGDKLDRAWQQQAALFDRLEPANRAQLEAVVAEIRQGRMEQGDIQRALDTIRHMLRHIQAHGLPHSDPELEQVLADIRRQLAADGDLALQQQLELSLPIIPLLLQYKVTVAGARNLGDVWREIIGPR